jgi:dephospho-CoA kinase
MNNDVLPFRVALTGGIASGKTAVANEFAALGVPVLDTDQIARDVVQPGSPALEQIVSTFGASALDSDGHLDRRRMRALVFGDAEARKKLEEITHPAIRTELARLSKAAGSAYQIHAIPLFAEGGAKGNYDCVLVVDCPEALQIRRLMGRDGVSEAQARQSLAAQATREQRLAVANDVIVNDGTLETLRIRVTALHRQYLELAAKKTGQSKL